ncbi:hypothetical protein Esti_000411 [Eimeria stiedai]
MESGHLFVYAAVARGKCVVAEYVARHTPEDVPRAAKQALLRLPAQQGRRSYVFQSHLFCFLVGEQYVFLCVSPQEVSPDISNMFLMELRTSLHQRLAMRPSSPPPNIQEEASQAILQQLDAIERGEGGGVQLISRVEKELEAVTDLVKDNINSVLERNEQIECLVGKTSNLKNDVRVTAMIERSCIPSVREEVEETRRRKISLPRKVQRDDMSKQALLAVIIYILQR